LSARLALHTGRLDDAYNQIARHRKTPQDPWLISAEIGLAQILGRTPRFAREAKSILSAESYSPAHTSELAGALATLELAAGKHRSARARYHQSLREPTENAVAQAVWAGKTDSSIVVPASALELPGSFEANFRRARRAGDWTIALDFAREWWLDEPYSSGPALAGSSIASMALNDCETAEEFARAGLSADPTQQVLLNNLTVALARQNRLPEAKSIFSRISRPFRNDLQEYVYNATRGLIAFRGREFDAGRHWYAKSDLEAPDADTRRLVLLHWAREEKAIDRDRYLRLIERSQPEPGKTYDPLIDSLRQTVTSTASLSSDASRPTKSGETCAPALDWKHERCS
jgi:tetratricopeptide (TPR) repeat protein